ncbi:MAG: molybdenum cofactor guanylyltransferase [Pseudomonadota bacterium]
MIMGAVLAGGMSTRFGSDKALAELDGRSLLIRAVDALNAMCDLVVIVGREAGPAFCLPDWPRAGMGPLGGIAAALRHAQDMGYASVVTCGVDCADLPETLVEELSPPSAYLESQPVIGHWLSDTAEAVEAILQSEGRHSMLAFAKAVNARAVTSTLAPANINTPADLAALEHR